MPPNRRESAEKSAYKSENRRESAAEPLRRAADWFRCGSAGRAAAGGRPTNPIASIVSPLGGWRAAGGQTKPIASIVSPLGGRWAAGGQTKPIASAMKPLGGRRWAGCGLSSGGRRTTDVLPPGLIRRTLGSSCRCCCTSCCKRQA